MEDLDLCKVVIASLVVVILLLLYHLVSVKVYRFHKPACPYCVSSQAAWDGFCSAMRFRLVRCIEIDLSTASPADAALADNLGASSVPTVVAVFPCGRRYEHGDKLNKGDFERTVEGYTQWVDQL